MEANTEHRTLPATSSRSDAGAAPNAERPMADAMHCELCEGQELCDRCGSKAAVMLILTERDARNIVAATEKGEAHRVIEILKRQLWWTEIAAGVRGLPTLRPLGAVH